MFRRLLICLVSSLLAMAGMPGLAHADTFRNKVTGETVRGKVLGATTKDGQKVYLVKGDDGQHRQLSQDEWERKWGDDSGPTPVAGEKKTDATSALPFPGREFTGVGATPEEARKNALVSAVEEAVGVLVIARTKVVDEVVEEKIITATNAYVDKYEILKQWQEQGVYNCRIVAHVCGRKLKMDLDANKIATRPLEGRDLAAWMETEERARQSAAEVLKDCLEDLPNKVLTIKATGSPVPVSSSCLRMPIEIGIDIGAYKQALGEIKYKVAQIARLKAHGVSRFVLKETTDDRKSFEGRFYGQPKVFECRDLENVDRNPIFPPPGVLLAKPPYYLSLSREKLWLDGLDGDERAIIKGLKEESTRLGRRLGFLFMVSQIGSQRTAQVNAYGLDEEAIQGLPRTRGCQLIAAVALMDAAGKEMAVKRVVFSPGSLGNSIFDHFVVLSVREEDFEGWPLLGVWPGFRGGEYGDLVQACYGNLYFDATSDELKQVQKMNLSVRWEP